MKHRQTVVSNFQSLCSGQTLWRDASDERTAGVAWDWVELQQGVAAMCDRPGLVTNMKLLDGEGEAHNRVAAAVQLHQLVHALPWQTGVQHTPHLR